MSLCKLVLLLLALVTTGPALSAAPIRREELPRLRRVNEILRSNIEEVDTYLTSSPRLQKI